MNDKRTLLITVLSALLVVLWNWVDPALAVVTGILSFGTLGMVSFRSKPQWIKAVWTWFKDAALDQSGLWSL